LLLVLALTGSGCVHTAGMVDEAKMKAPVIEEAPSLPPPAPPVTADQITEENALDQAHSLGKEIERDSRSAPVAKPARNEAR